MFLYKDVHLDNLITLHKSADSNECTRYFLQWYVLTLTAQKMANGDYNNSSKVHLQNPKTNRCSYWGPKTVRILPRDSVPLF
jgi:hypothetical protein